MSALSPSRDIQAPVGRATLDLTSPRGKSFDGFSRLLINLLLDSDGGLRRIGGWDNPPGGNGDLHDQLLSSLDAPLPDPASTLEIYNDPDNVWFTVGKGFGMAAEARGGVPPYVWQWFWWDGSAWLRIITSGTAVAGEILMLNADGAQSPSLSFWGAELNRSGQYKVGVKDQKSDNLDPIVWTSDDVYSQPGTASTDVYDTAGVAPAFFLQPESRTVTEGEPVSFWVAANGSQTITYQWQKYAGMAWGDMPGETSDTLEIDPAATSDATEYRCVATNPYGTATSDAATLEVNPASTAYGDQSYHDATYLCGSSVTRSFVITNPRADQTLTIVWQAATGLCSDTVATPANTVIAPSGSATLPIPWNLTGCTETGESPDFRLVGVGTFSGGATGFNVYLTGETSNLCS